MSQKSSNFAALYRAAYTRMYEGAKIKTRYKKKFKIQKEYEISMDNQSLLTYNGDEAIVVYQSEDNTLRLDVQMAQETVWLTQQQMAELFQSSRTNIVEHIRHIYRDHELEEDATSRKFRQVQKALQQAADNFNKQYGDLTMHAVKSIQDRFLIIDDKEIYLIGASLKDLGRKLFAFSKMEPQQIDVLKNYLAKA